MLISVHFQYHPSRNVPSSKWPRLKTSPDSKRLITERSAQKTTQERNDPNSKWPRAQNVSSSNWPKAQKTQGTKWPKTKSDKKQKPPKATMYSVRVVHVFTWQIGAPLTGNRLNIFRPVEHFSGLCCWYGQPNRILWPFFSPKWEFRIFGWCKR